jgi:hypothetical protein
MAAPDHVAWLEDTGEVIETADGREAEIWALQHADDPAILSAWATHYRQHYCRDEDLPDLVADTGLSNADFLANIKFPDPVAAPGPSTRAGDFGWRISSNLSWGIGAHVKVDLRIAKTAMCLPTAPT